MLCRAAAGQAAVLRGAGAPAHLRHLIHCSPIHCSPHVGIPRALADLHLRSAEQLPGERQRFRVLGPLRTYATSQSWVEVDYGRLAGNAGAVLRQLPAGALPLAMVLGNGYGHGLDFAAKAFVGAGFQELGVNDINEAITLRQASLFLTSPTSALYRAVPLDWRLTLQP